MSKFVKIDDERLVNLDYVTHVYASGSRMTFYLNSSKKEWSMTKEFDTAEECDAFFKELMGM